MLHIIKLPNRYLLHSDTQQQDAIYKQRNLLESKYLNGMLGDTNMGGRSTHLGSAQ